MCVEEGKTGSGLYNQSVFFFWGFFLVIKKAVIGGLRRHTV